LSARIHQSGPLEASGAATRLLSTLYELPKGEWQRAATLRSTGSACFEGAPRGGLPKARLRAALAVLCRSYHAASCVLKAH
jgi:hypothetical protein